MYSQFNTHQMHLHSRLHVIMPGTGIPDFVVKNGTSIFSLLRKNRVVSKTRP